MMHNGSNAARPERRTLIRREADRFSAGVMRGEVSPWAGPVEEVPEVAWPDDQRELDARRIAGEVDPS